MSVPTDQFQPVTTPAPDWSAAVNWSAGAVPDVGMTAAITGTMAMIDPGVTIDTSLILAGSVGRGTGLEGNGGAIVLGAQAAIATTGAVSLYAADRLANQGSIAVAGGSTLTVVVDLGALSGLTGAAPPSFANQGIIALAPGAMLAVEGTAFENSGTVSLATATLDVTGGALAGHGTIALSQDATAWFGDGVAGQSFDFGAGGGTIAFADPLLGSGITIAGFGAGDTIALPGLADATISQADGTVTLFDARGDIEGSFALGGGALLAVRAAGAGSVIVAVDAAAPAAPPCFAGGTCILTPSGYRPVEQLAAGDKVITAGGAVHSVIWAGRRDLDLAGHPTPHQVRPIRIAAGALAPGIPRRPLRLSPDHAVFLEGVLIPAKLLVNGATIVQDAECLAVTYHHVELARHDVLLAEGAPCESYLDTGNRDGFDASSTCGTRPKRWDRDACAPLVTTGGRLAQARATLHRRTLASGFVARADPAIELWVGRTRITPNPAGRHSLPKAHGGTASLRSARFAPSCFDPASEDRRTLGVALALIRAGRRSFRPDDLAVAGFHARSSGDAALWTDGLGTIRLPAGARSIAFDIAALPLVWQRRPAA